MTAPFAGDDDGLYQSLDTCAISDAMESVHGPGYAALRTLRGLSPAWPGARALGYVMTTRLAPGPAPAGAPHLGVRAIETAAPGSVIVIDNGGRTDAASWGGLLSAAAGLRGIAGVVTNGAARDIDEARDLGFAVFSGAVTARTARGRYHEASCGEPVSFGPLTIEAGDFIAADASAVLVIARADVPAVLDRAAGLAARERAMKAALIAGRPPSAVLGGSYEDMLKTE